MKPSNVLVDQDGQLKLLDFGIALLLGDKPEHLTHAGAMTPKYASPEQLLGKPISIATDIYQIGLLATKVLCGTLPNEDEKLENAVTRAVEGRALALNESHRHNLPSELRLIIEQCLRHEPVSYTHLTLPTKLSV